MISWLFSLKGAIQNWLLPNLKLALLINKGPQHILPQITMHDSKRKFKPSVRSDAEETQTQIGAINKTNLEITRNPNTAN